CVGGSSSDASVSGDGPLPIDACNAACADPNTVQTCDGQMIACANGCIASPPHCAAIDLPLGLTDDLLTGATAAVPGDTLVCHTDTGAIDGVRGAGSGVISGIDFAAPGGLGVFVAASFSVPPGTTWTATGGSALVLLADTIEVDGTIDVGATG